MTGITNIWDFVQAGGWAMWPLLACSIVLWAVILERFFKFWDLLGKCQDQQDKILPLIYKKQFEIVNDTNKNAKLPVEILSVYAVNKRNQKNLDNKLNNKRKEIVQDLKKPLWLLGTIGASAPFIGLFGTVVGIIRSFHSISVTGTSGFTVVSAGISEALIATAVGLFVAIPALWAYNHYQQKIKKTFSLADQLVDQFKNEHASQNES